MGKSEDCSPEKPVEPIQENGIVNDEVEETSTRAAPNLIGRPYNSDADAMGQPIEDATKSSNGEHLGSLSPDKIKQIVANFLRDVSAENSMKGYDGKEPADHGINDFTPDGASKFKSRFSSGKKKKTTAKQSKRKNLGSDSQSNKTLLSSGRSEASEQKTDAEHTNSTALASCSRERRRKKKKRLRENADDVFTKIRKQVRYILNKISYEQSLIDAYGGEGWKGLSVDKLKPEKELQRASSEILRCKLRLRDLFQHLDDLCAEGSYPRSMFDSEGLLDSEDIYCIICGSKDLSANNDIVLCDGECNRAFHQLCLEPSLLTEEIPPDDQGWLCPGCDCKFDCMEFLNDSLGTDLSLKHNWENVFPEAAAAADGANMQDEILRLPSDDSGDNDFDPDNIDIDENVKDDNKSEEGGASSEGEESASDESDFTSASEDLGDFINEGQLNGNPPDNSEEEEDEDYDPDAPELDEQIKEESSSSDFTSDSEDFVAEVDNVTSKVNENSELAALVTEQESPIPSSKTRGVERLEYKKLYDETYANASSDSSDDEEWTEAWPSRKRKNKNQKVDYTLRSKNIERYADSSNGEEWTEVEPSRKRKKKNIWVDSTVPRKNIKDSVDDKTDAERRLRETECSAPKRPRKKVNSSSENVSVVKSPPKSLGEAAKQTLTEAFRKNQYPERAVKENLAKEFGISYQKVDKWFGNARWSLNHPLHTRTVSKSDITKKSSSQATPGSKTAVIANSSNNHSARNQSDAKAGANGSPVKVSSPLKPLSTKAGGKQVQSKNLRSPKSSAAGTTIQVDASKSPRSQSSKRRFAHHQETVTSYFFKVEANNPSTNNTEGSANAGESSKVKATTPTPNKGLASSKLEATTPAPNKGSANAGGSKKLKATTPTQNNGSENSGGSRKQKASTPTLYKGSANAGQSSKQKPTTPTPNSKQRGGKAVPSSEKAPNSPSGPAPVVVALRSPSTAMETRQTKSPTRKSGKKATKLYPCNQKSASSASASTSTKAGGATKKSKIQTRSRK